MFLFNYAICLLVILFICILLSVCNKITLLQFRFLAAIMLLANVVYSLIVHTITGAIVNFILSVAMFIFWYDGQSHNNFDKRLKK